MKNFPTPQTISELYQRARAIAGKPLGELAQITQSSVPKNMINAKGWVGKQLEIILGANAGNKALPDFYHLGVELKSIPLKRNLTPAESTYVCTVPMNHKLNASWHDCAVCKKLSHVLWMPVEADKLIPIAERRVGTPLLWQPNSYEEKQLATDWEDITYPLVYGDINQIDSKIGTYLHIRPKATNSNSLTWIINENGERIQNLPRGFYLRTSFTKYLLKKYLYI